MAELDMLSPHINGARKGIDGLSALVSSKSKAPGISTTTTPAAIPFKTFIANAFAVNLFSIISPLSIMSILKPTWFKIPFENPLRPQYSPIFLD